MRLRHFLILMFMALTLIPVAVFRLWPDSAVFETELDEVEERHLLLARNMGAALERYHRDVSNTFKLVISTPAIWEASDQVAGTLSNLGLTHICIADGKSGRLLHQITTPEHACPRTINDDFRSRFSTLAQSDAIFTEVMQSPQGNNAMYILKVLPGDRIVFGELRTDYFIELGKAISFGKMGHAAIVDHLGNVLYHPLDEWTAARRNIAKVSAVQRMMNGETSVDVFYSPALKADMIAGFTSVPPVGWGVMIPQPLSELREKADFVHNAAVFVLFAGLSGSFILALLVSSFSARPIEQISAAARRIAHGELYDPSEIKTGRLLPREFHDLHDSFRNMVKQLRISLFEIKKLAFTDSLTQLANRESFRQYLCTFIENSDPQASGMLLFVDLDGFKLINDTQGHDAGDEVLKGVAHHLSEILTLPKAGDALQPDSFSPKPDADAPIAARLGGDEFAVFLPNKSKDAAFEIGQDILRAIGVPAYGQTVRVGASIGLACYPEDGTSYSELLKAADLAMYDAKRAGKNRIALFSSTFAEASDAQSQLAGELAEGFALGQFDVHFQPVYHAQTLSLHSVEAVLRWHHPRLGLLDAESFVMAARDYGYQRKIDMFVLEQTMGILSDLSMRGATIPAVSINFWMDSFADQDLVDHIIRTKTRFPCPLTIELINPLAQSDARALWGLDQLRDVGIGIVMDDFGADARAISDLIELQATTLKIDKDIIAHARSDKRHSRLLASIIEMGHAQNIMVGAKGIDAADQIEVLGKIGCDFLQGRALNSPMMQEELFLCITSSSLNGARASS